MIVQQLTNLSNQTTTIVLINLAGNEIKDDGPAWMTDVAAWFNEEDNDASALFPKQ